MNLARGNTPEAIEFLTTMRPGGPWLLSAIRPDKADGLPDIDTRQWRGNQVEEMRRWIDKYQGHMNLYLHVNPMRDVGNKKASRVDVAAMDHIHVDIDPRTGEDREAERERIFKLVEKLEPPPTYVVDSGNGCNVYWKLSEPVPLDGTLDMANHYAGYNYAMEVATGADKCHNLDRILRLPGTLNLPNAKKRENGRTPQRSKVITSVPSRIYVLDKSFKHEAIPDLRPPGATATREPGKTPPRYVAPEIPEGEPDLDDLLPLAEHRKIKELVLVGDSTDTPYHDRSGLVWHVACAMHRAGLHPDVAARLLLWRRPKGASKISDHIFEQPNPRSYVARQVERAGMQDKDFHKSEEGKVLPTQGNVRIALHKLGLEISRDEWADRMPLQGWPQHPELTDKALDDLYLTVEDKFGFRPNKDYFDRVILVEADRNRYHPVKDYLDSLVWDKKPRIDGWLKDYGGATAPDHERGEEYLRAVGSLVLIAAVRRIREPGCKFDEMLVLESEEGRNKSSALRALAVQDDWFTDQFPLGAEPKLVLEAVQARWIVEMAELTGMRKADVDKVKAQLSAVTDSARMAYARIRTDRPRQCVFIGTTNSTDYLKSVTGNRRFWPVKVSGFDVEAIRRDRDQLWAEACEREAARESIRLPQPLWACAQIEQHRRIERDAWEDELGPVLAGLEGKVRMVDLWSFLGIEPKVRGQHGSSLRLRNVMMRLGWRRPNAGGQLRFGGTSPESAWVCGPDGSEWEWITLDRMQSEGVPRGSRPAQRDPNAAPF